MFDRVRDLPAARHTLIGPARCSAAMCFPPRWPTTVSTMRRRNRCCARPLWLSGRGCATTCQRRRWPPATASASWPHAIAGSFDAATCLALAAQRAQLMDGASPPMQACRRYLAWSAMYCSHCAICTVRTWPSPMGRTISSWAARTPHCSSWPVPHGRRVPASVRWRCTCLPTRRCWRRRSHRSLPHSMPRRCKPACRCWPASMRGLCVIVPRWCTRCRRSWRRPSNGRR